MIIALYTVAAVIMAVGSLYLAWRNRNFCTFLGGAFFVSSLHLVLSLSCRRFGASVGDKFCRNTSGQRWPLYRAFHPLPALFLFWLRQEAKDLKRTICPLLSPHAPTKFSGCLIQKVILSKPGRITKMPKTEMTLIRLLIAP